MIHGNRRYFCTACASLLLTACADVKLPDSLSNFGGSKKGETTIDTVGQLPPPPARTWPDPKLDLNNARSDGWGLVPAPDMESYLNGLLATIKKTAGTPGYPGSVHVIADTSLNANSSAAGNIFISVGWLQLAESEDEIFAILSHEFGHIYLNHHAIFDVKTAGDTTVAVTSLAWSLANKTASSSTWTGIDNIAVVQTLGTRVLFPAWQRSVEEQADRFGATISLSCGYSYTDGFKAFLERVESYDKAAKERRQKLHAQQVQTARAKAGKNAAAQSKTQPLVPGLTMTSAQMGSIGSIGGLSEAMASFTTSRADVQSTAAQNVFDVQQMLEDRIASAAESLHDDHGDPAAREDDLSERVRPLIAGKRPDPRVDSWLAARKRGTTPQILAHYVSIADLQNMQADGRYDDALRLAQTIASGVTANDALPTFLLSNTMSLAGARQPDVQTQVLRRNLNSRDRSWAIQTNLATRIAAKDRSQGETFLLQQFDYFGKASATWPAVIAFYREHGDAERAKNLALTCTANYPEMRPACVDAAQTPSEKHQSSVASGLEHAKKMGADLFKKLGQ
jgi:beta-barrel assembly-enhancing protease